MTEDTWTQLEKDKQRKLNHANAGPPYTSFTDADVWHEWERQSSIPSFAIRAVRFDRTQASRAQLDKALHSTQLEPPASGLRNLAAWLAVLAVAGAIGAAIVARRGR